jgi:hypothetical protein
MSEGIRSNRAIVRELMKYGALMWYGRHMGFSDEHKAKWEPDIRAGAKKIAREVERKYPKEEIIRHRGTDTYELGMVTGKVAALRWLMGGQWNELDS